MWKSSDTAQRNFEKAHIYETKSEVYVEFIATGNDIERLMECIRRNPLCHSVCIGWSVWTNVLLKCLATMATEDQIKAITIGRYGREDDFETFKIYERLHQYKNLVYITLGNRQAGQHIEKRNRYNRRMRKKTLWQLLIPLAFE